jgi:hypothetical protein
MQLTQNENLVKRSSYSFDQNELLTAIEALQTQLSRFDITCKPFSADALSKLHKFNDSVKLNAIAKDFVLQSEIFQDIVPDIENPHANDIAALKNALKFFGLRLEEEFWTKLSSDDVIEIYNPNMIQLYRSLNFYNKTGYSLLDLVMNEWYVLWERPAKALEEVAKAGLDAVNGAKGLSKMTIKKHIIKEIYNTGATEPFEPRCLTVNFKYIAPLYKSVTSNIEAFIVTTECSLLTVGQGVYDLDFI